MSAPTSSAAPLTVAAAPAADTVTLKRLVDVLLFVGPSGCGKTTIINQLQQEFPELFEFSVSHTTRQPRSGEVNGKHYHFVTFDAFQDLINSGAMIEYSRLSTQPSTDKRSGNMYGTSKKALHKVLNDNRVVLMDTDLLGAINIRRYCAHVVVDSKPVTVLRKDKRKSAITPTTNSTTPTAAQAKDATPLVAVNVETSPTTGTTGSARHVKVLPEETTAAQPPPAWRLPRFDIASVHLKCHSELPSVPPVSSMPNANRLVRCIVIFIAPPSIEALKQRLRERKSETGATFRMRMELSTRWMHWAQENQAFFDYYIVNDNLKLCYEKVRQIVTQEVLAVTSSL